MEQSSAFGILEEANEQKEREGEGRGRERENAKTNKQNKQTLI